MPLPPRAMPRAFPRLLRFSPTRFPLPAEIRRFRAQFCAVNNFFFVAFKRAGRRKRRKKRVQFLVVRFPIIEAPLKKPRSYLRMKFQCRKIKCGHLKTFPRSRAPTRRSLPCPLPRRVPAREQTAAQSVETARAAPFPHGKAREARFPRPCVPARSVEASSRNRCAERQQGGAD